MGLSVTHVYSERIGDGYDVIQHPSGLQIMVYPKDEFL